MLSTSTNLITFAQPESLNATLLEWLKLQALRDNSHLLLMTVSVPFQGNYKKTHFEIRNQIQERMTKLSGDEYFNSSNLGDYIFFKDGNECLALSVTFGKNTGLNFDLEIEAFASRTLRKDHGFHSGYTLPLIRLCFGVFTLQHQLSKADKLPEYAMLNFGQDRFVYRLAKEYFQPLINEEALYQNAISLRVASPQIFFPKNQNELEIETGLLFHEAETGIWIYDRELAKKGSKNADKTAYRYFISPDKKEGIPKEITKALDTRYLQEVHWFNQFTRFLDNLEIPYQIQKFNPQLSIKVDQSLKPKGKAFSPILSQMWPDHHLNITFVVISTFFKSGLLDETDENGGERLGEESAVNEYSFKKALLQGLQETASKLRLNIEFVEADEGQLADITVGDIPSEVQQWRKLNLLKEADAYGYQRLKAIKDSVLNPTQFIGINTILKIERDKTISIQKDILTRSLIDCFLKKVITANKLVKPIEVEFDESMLQPKQFIVHGTQSINKQPIDGNKANNTRRNNLFACTYKANISKRGVSFHKLSTGLIDGFSPKTKQSTPFSTLISIMELSPALEKSSMMDLFILLRRAALSDKAKAAVDRLMSINNGLLFFELDKEGEIERIWATEECKINTLPLPDGYDPTKDIRDQFIKLAEGGLLSRQFRKGLSILNDDTRLAGDPEYSLMIEGNKVCILRRKYSPNATETRKLIKLYQLIWDRNQPEVHNPNINVEDISIILSSLSSDYLGLHKQSGVKTTLYEKVIRLALSD